MFQSMNNISESLAGRIAILNLYGLSVSEINQVEESKYIPTYDNLMKRIERYQTNIEEVFDKILRGSYPELYRNKNIDIGIFYSSYVQTYLEKDIRNVLKIQDEEKRKSVAQKLLSGEMIHVTPISAKEAIELGLPVSTELPSEVHDFMKFFRSAKMSVEYIE